MEYRDSKFTFEEIERASKEINTQYLQNIEIYNDFMQNMEKLIKKILDSSNIKLHMIKSRVKEKNSLKIKIAKKASEFGDDEKYKLYENINEITDICGLRIILINEKDIDKVSEIIKREFVIDEKNSVDKRDKPYNEFGYLSNHHVVSLSNIRLSLLEYEKFREIKFEIQTRTVLQHSWAEIEHKLGYKSEKIFDNELRRNLHRLAATLELVDYGFSQILTYDENDKNMKLDDIKLYALIKRNKYIKKLDNEIIINTSSFINNDVYNPTFILKNLNYLMINYVDELENYLEDYFEELKLFIMQFKNKKVIYNYKGISLLYLCLFISNEKFSFEEQTVYLDSIKFDYNVENLQKSLVNAYKRVKYLKKYDLMERI